MSARIVNKAKDAVKKSGSPIGKIRRLHYHHLVPDFLLTCLSLYLSLALRVDFDLMRYLPALNKHMLLFGCIRLGCFVFMGVYDVVWRYIGFDDAIKISKAILTSSVLVIAASYIVDIGRIPRGVFFIDATLATILIVGIRFLTRFVYEYFSDREHIHHGRRALIYGAGTNGRTLANRFNTDRGVGHHIIGFIDDDPKKMNRSIGGTEVLGTTKDLAKIISERDVQEVIIAIAKPTGKTLRKVVEICHQSGIRPRIISAFAQSERHAHLDVLREISLSDLLNRPPKSVDRGTIRSYVSNKRVLVTGAGGSIGSELARQILNYKPASLLLLDHSEYNLYNIDKELRVSQSSSLTIPLLTDIKDRGALKRVFQNHRPQIIFHAAAYKHVHLVEKNVNSAILNNVMGTRNLLSLAEEHGADGFVLISTDKAVNPAGVMGATKRLCELMVADCGRRLSKRYCSVRFGNVLGSSGSLIPLLKDQIQNDEPITITHPDMTRYFMLIPEAVSLVLKAAGMAAPGEINILKMGEPVKITDLAKALRSLLGKTEEQCPLVFTGIRPGEKLSEELYLSGDEIVTDDPDILVVPDHAQGFTETSIEDRVEQLIEDTRSNHPEVVASLNSIISERPDTSSAATPFRPLPQANLPKDSKEGLPN